MDGDSDSGQVLRELRRCIHREIASLRRERAVDSTDERKGAEGKLCVAMNVSYLRVCGSTKDSSRMSSNLKSIQIYLNCSYIFSFVLSCDLAKSGKSWGRHPVYSLFSSPQLFTLDPLRTVRSPVTSLIMITRTRTIPHFETLPSTEYSSIPWRTEFPGMSLLDKNKNGRDD